MLTNIKTNYRTYSIDKIDEEMLAKIFDSKTNEVWGVEFNGRELHLITPPCIRLNARPIHKLIENLPKHAYAIRLTRPSFLPLFSEQPLQLFSQLQDEDMFIQFLFQKATNKQMLNIVDQYEDFLNGVDNPSYNKFLRKGQRKILNFLEKFVEIEQKERIPDVEDKILSCCYFFNIRLFVDENVSGIESILNELSYYNEFEIINEPNLHELTVNRTLENSYRQILSDNEIRLLLCDEIKKSITINDDTINDDVEETETTSVAQTAIHLLPAGQKIERQIDEELIHKVPHALQKAKVIKDHKIEIIDIELGATVQRITMKIPKGLTYTDIKKRYEDIKAAMATDLSIIQGNEPNTVTFLIPCKQRDIIYLKTILESHEFIKFAQENSLPFVCGIDMHNQPVFKCLTNAPHLLIAGETNSGKSVFVNALLITLILLKSPDELHLYLIDPKMVEFTNYERIPHVKKLIINMEEAKETLESLTNEMDERYKLFSQKKVKKISDYNKKSNKRLPYIVCAIDEYNDLKMQYKEVETIVERLGQKARAAGIHLIICTQRPDKNVMTGIIKANLPSKICFKLGGSSHYRTVFDTGIPYNLIGFGDGVVQYVAQTEPFIRFQSPVVSLNSTEEEEFFENLKKYLKGEIILQEDVIEELPLDKLKRIIATTNETRVKELQQQMGIRINDVSDLMKQLVDEGWLEKEGRGYKIIASEEELNKWRG